MPHVVAAYEEFHKRGLDVIGVTLDASQRVPTSTVAAFVKDQRMPWPQVYQDADRLADAFGVSGIPVSFLIDGDTGAILAADDELRGLRLIRTIASHLKK